VDGALSRLDDLAGVAWTPAVFCRSAASSRSLAAAVAPPAGIVAVTALARVRVWVVRAVLTGGQPAPAGGFANALSRGAHTRTFVPGSRDRAAGPTIGPAFPRGPPADNDTRISRPPFP